MGDLNRYFNYREFKCQGTDCCGGSHPVHPELADGLEQLRELVGIPIVITSGFRCRRHNIEIGGEKKSYHMLAMAADIKCDGLTPDELAKWATQVEQFNNGGIGVYVSWVHVDVRQGGRARWRG